MGKDKPHFKLEAWAFINLNDWHNHYSNSGGGRCESHRGIVGWCRVVAEEELPMSLKGSNESRWVVFVYRTPERKTPFAIVPGCKVYSVHVLEGAPDFVGFCTAAAPEAAGVR